MTTKQLKTLNDIYSTPIFKTTIGFDQLFRDLMNNGGLATTNSGYPPCNITRLTDARNEVSYEICMAVAGFTEDDIEVTVDQNRLMVSGEISPQPLDPDVTVEFLNKGIAERSFSRSWPLSENLEVQDAVLKDGMLRIRLKLNIPEEEKPKKIQVLRQE